MKKFCIISIIMCVVIFLLFAFATWNINPAMWTVDIRAVCATTLAFGLFVLVICYYGFN